MVAVAISRPITSIIVAPPHSLNNIEKIKIKIKPKTTTKPADNSLINSKFRLAYTSSGNTAQLCVCVCVAVDPPLLFALMIINVIKWLG